MVAVDGEALLMETPLKYRIRKGALRLILPIEDGEGTPRSGVEG